MSYSSASPVAFKPAPTRFVPTAPLCAACGERAYAAESVTGPASRTYHKKCFKCTACKKALDSSSLLEHEGQPFCKPCHLKAFGPKGYGYGGSVGGDYVDRSAHLSPVRKMARSSTQEWTPPRVDTPLYLQSERDSESANGDEMDRPDSPFSSSSTTTAATSTGRSSPFRTNSNSGVSSSTCRRCGETCYFAEQVLAAGNKWHKRCLRCAKCSKALDSHLSVRQDLPYCKKCYGEEAGLSRQGVPLMPGLF